MKTVAYTAFSTFLTLATAWSLGMLALQRLRLSLYRMEAIPLAVLSGSVLLNALVFAICAAGIARKSVFLALGASAIFLAFWSGAYRVPAKQFPALARSWRIVMIAGFGLAVIAHLLLSFPRQFSPDTLMYRVSLVANGLQNFDAAHFIYFYAAAAGRYEAAPFINLTLLVSMGVLVACMWRRYGYHRAGVIAAILALLAPLNLAGQSLAFSRTDVLAASFGLFYLMLMCHPSHWAKALVMAVCVWECSGMWLSPLVPISVLAVGAFVPAASLLAGLSIVSYRWLRAGGLRPLLTADYSLACKGMAVGIVLAMLLWFSWPGIHSYFVDDDILNLRNAIGVPAGKLVYQTFALSPDGYRPAGLLWYKTMREIAGMNLLPFRIAPMLFLVLNLGLMCLFAFALTGSLEIMSLAALIGCFHSRMTDLYFSSADIYDILCYTFYFAALLAYIRRRNDSRPIGYQGWAILLLQVLALGAKEMAVTFPVLLLVFEAALSLQRGSSRGRRWWMDAGWLISAAFAISAAFCARKLLGSTILNQAYHPIYSSRSVLDNWRHYLGLMFYRNDPLPWIGLIFLLGVVIGAAIAYRSSVWTMTAALILIAPLPVLFVSERGLNMMYIPMTGWAIFAASAIDGLRRKWWGQARGHTVAPAATFLCTTILLAWAHHNDRPGHIFSPGGRVDAIEPYLESLKLLHPVPPRDLQIRLLNDPFPPDEWYASMILDIYFDRVDIQTLRDKVPEQRRAILNRQFDEVFDWRNGQLIPVEGPNRDSPVGASQIQ